MCPLLKIEGEVWEEKRWAEPLPVWFSCLGDILQTKGLLALFLVKANAWVVGSVPGWGAYGRQ